MKVDRQMEDILGQFFSNHDKLKKMSKVVHDNLSSVDRELSEFYHRLEGIHLSHNTQAHPLMVKLQDILERRRNLKKDTILIRSFLDNTEKSMDVAKARSETAMKKHEKVLNAINTLKDRKKMHKH